MPLSQKAKFIYKFFAVRVSQRNRQSKQAQTWEDLEALEEHTDPPGLTGQRGYLRRIPFGRWETEDQSSALADSWLTAGSRT